MRSEASETGRAVPRTRVLRSLLPLDVLLVPFCYVFVIVLRYSGNLPDPVWHAFLLFLPVAVVVHIAANWIFGLYRAVWRYASIREARRVRAAAFAACAVLFAGTFATGLEMPRSVVILGSFVVAVILGGVRLFRPLGLAQDGLPYVELPHNETGGAA